MGRECDPVLVGGRECKYSHGFSEAEMDSLATICDTILPMVSSVDGQHQQPAKSFLESASGSHAPVPDEIAEHLAKRALVEACIIARVVLLMLSTRLGTLLLCGSLCFTEKWPFINAFSAISLEKRERILHKWFKCWYLPPIRLVFSFIKVLCLATFFTQVNGKGENPAWEAIGYHVETEDNMAKEHPLEKGIIETTKETDSSLVQSLTKKGIQVTADTEHDLHSLKCDVVVVGSGWSCSCSFGNFRSQSYRSRERELFYELRLLWSGRPLQESTV